MVKTVGKDECDDVAIRAEAVMGLLREENEKNGGWSIKQSISV